MCHVLPLVVSTAVVEEVAAELAGGGLEDPTEKGGSGGRPVLAFFPTSVLLSTGLAAEVVQKASG